MLETGGKETDGSLEEREIHDVLRNDRRRLAIEALRESDDTASVADLSEAVAAGETGERPPPRDKRQSVYISLRQTHLPRLDELGLIDYDEETKEVRLRDRIEEVEVYMEVVPRYGLSWGEFYFGLALLGFLTTVAAIVGVPGIASLHLGYLVAGYFALLMGISANHVYAQQNRLLLERFLD